MAPEVLGLFPQDLDAIQFRAVRGQVIDLSLRPPIAVSVPKRSEKRDVAIEEPLGVLGIRQARQMRILHNSQNFTSCPRTTRRNPLDVVVVIGKYVIAPIRNIFQHAQHDVTQRVVVDPVVLRRMNLAPESTTVQAPPIASTIMRFMSTLPSNGSNLLFMSAAVQYRVASDIAPKPSGSYNASKS